LYEKADLEKLPTDSSPYLSPTKRMIVEENPEKWKIYFGNCAFDTPKGTEWGRIREVYKAVYSYG
jgi:hypothetical protein